MPAITTITIYPDQPGDQKSVSEAALIDAAKTRHRPVAGQWSVLEAVTWIATYSHEMVRGVAPFHIESAAPIARQLQLRQPFGEHSIVANNVAHTIARKFCRCERKITSPLCVHDWNQLSAAEQEAAANDSQAKNRSLYISAHTRNCTCFDTAARALFAAAVVGDVVATAGTEQKKIPRQEWQHADYDLMEGLRFGPKRVGSVCFASAVIRRQWPITAVTEQKSREPGRPDPNLEPVEAEFRDRRGRGIPLESSQEKEWARCIESLNARNIWDLPKPDTCYRRLGHLYRAAKKAGKSG